MPLIVLRNSALMYSRTIRCMKEYYRTSFGSLFRRTAWKKLPGNHVLDNTVCEQMFLELGSCGSSRHITTTASYYAEGPSTTRLPVVTLFTKEDCSLCDDAKVIIEEHKDKLLLQVIDITYPGNEYWYEAYKYDIPVLHIDGHYSMKHKVFEPAFIESLKNATSRKSSTKQKDLFTLEKDILRHEAMNFFTGSPLNKMSMSRKDENFITSAVRKPNSKFILFHQLNPLTYKNQNSKMYSLIELTYNELSELLGPDFDCQQDIIFLGSQVDTENEDKSYRFAVNFSGGNKTQTIEERLQGSFLEARFSRAFPILLQMNQVHGSIACQARSMLAWHESHKYCATCGSATYSTEGGYKRTCTDDNCGTNRELSNISYPRVDPVVMNSVISMEKKAILLGRKPTFPRGMYSCLSGFVDPGESMEDAATREVFEESGVMVRNISYHSSQPWPFPSSLMIGCCSEATNDKLSIDTEELEDLRWFKRSEVLELLDPKAFKQGKLFVPPRQTIAHNLIEHSVNLLQ